MASVKDDFNASVPMKLHVKGFHRAVNTIHGFSKSVSDSMSEKGFSCSTLDSTICMSLITFGFCSLYSLAQLKYTRSKTGENTSHVKIVHHTNIITLKFQTKPV